MWDLPGPGTKHMSSALAARFFTTLSHQRSLHSNKDPAQPNIKINLKAFPTP